MQSKPVIVILAAGRGTRFEGAVHKLAQPFGSSTVLGTTLSHAIESQLGVVVVTVPDLVDLASTWLARRDIVVLADQAGSAGWHGGMGVSIAAGVAARADATGWLVLPGDMPLVRPDTLRSVAQALELHLVACAQYQGRRGHPVGFSAELYSELTQLGGDEGARRVVARYPSIGLELDDPGVLVDIDTQQDLERARIAR